MPKGKYTRKTAGLQAFLETTGIALPESATLEEIKEYTHALPEDQQKRCHSVYIQYMSIGRPEYLENYSRKK